MSIRNKDVLIIDDDPDLRVLVKRVLENVGLHVWEASGVDMALVEMRNHSPHLVIVDLQMPEKDGFHFLEKIKEHPGGDQIPVIVLSALSDKSSVFKAISLGAKDYLTKPFQASIMLQKIRKNLRDSDFLSFTFDSKNSPELKFTIDAKVLKLHEEGFVLEAPVRIAPNTTIAAKSKILDETGLSGCVFRTTLRTGGVAPSGFYLSPVQALGMNDQKKAAIEVKVQELKTASKDQNEQN